MKKGGKSELKKDNPLKNVAEKSKVNKKKTKKLNKPLNNVQKVKIENSSQAQVAVKEKKDKKNKKGPKQPIEAGAGKVEVKSEQEVQDPKELAKLEKKKAKKLAKKLKKKQQKENGIKSPQAKPAVTNGTKKGAQKDAKGDVARDPLQDAATVFVGNLPTTTKRIQLVKLFAKYGGVNAIRFRTASGNILYKHKQRKKAGSLNAYVTLIDVDAAKKALELNGCDFKGNHLRITPSDKSHSQDEHNAKCTVFVGNLKYTANAQKLHEIFSNCGEIDYIRCLTDGKENCKGVAYVCFKSAEAVGLALELNETLLDERPIHVERYSLKKLGAKEARDKQAATQKKQFTGAKKRIDAKKIKQSKSKDADSDNNKKKKSEFRGVKVTGIKKQGKKKITNEMKNLAKKIAPKAKKETE